MKTNRLRNGSFENANETVGSLTRAPVTGPARLRKSSTSRCATPERPARRRPEPALKAFTTITAKVDVGFGNSVFIRGEGAGLNWQKGQPLVCVDGSTWVWSHDTGSEAVTFKLLLNDQVWCGGDNFTVGAGEHAHVSPVF